MDKNASMPILVPLEPGEFWQSVRLIVREELAGQPPKKQVDIMRVTGLVEKPLYKMQEICAFFEVSRRTVYDWIKAGRLHPVKIRSRVYFVGAEIHALIKIG